MTSILTLWNYGNLNPNHNVCVTVYGILVRLDLGKSLGPVELNVENRWGYICDDNWTEKEAAVTCRQLGYKHGREACCSLFGKRYYYRYALVIPKLICMFRKSFHIQYLISF